MQNKTWKLTMIENGEPSSTHILSHHDAAKAINWVAQGGSIEDLVGPEQPVEIGIRHAERQVEVPVAA